MTDIWKEFAKACEVPLGKSIVLDRDFDPAHKSKLVTKKSSVGYLASAVDLLFELQDKFFAQSDRSLLIILQATDAAGKDGTIKHVMSGLNPEGVDVYSYKQPSSAEMAHDYLWRHVAGLPALGKISIFNRSHYENVLICRVHPDALWPAAARQVKPTALWKRRYREINDWERYLTDNGTVIVKLFLNLSKDEQRRRFLSRIDEPAKNWKFSGADLREREYWDKYRAAFQDMINNTNTDYARWNVIPADHKWFSHLATSAVLVEAFRAIDPSYPTVPAADLAKLEQAKVELLAEG